MRFIELSESDYLNVSLIDKQHENVAKFVNELYDHLYSDNKNEIISIMNGFVEELELHFETEEKLMKENRFPGYISHKLEHDRFYNQTLKTVESYRTDQSVLNLKTLESIKRWFFNHIEINDKKCGKYFTSIGIS